MQRFSLHNGKIIYEPNFFTVSKAGSLYQHLSTEIQWEQRFIKMFGKSIMEPRLTAWYGNKDATYQYSGISLTPLAWTENLLEIKGKIEQLTNYTFNSVLLNWYRDGNDSMGWHSDDEKELGMNPIIASLSLGATRDFQIRRKDNHKEKRQFALTSGSLLLMSGEMQKYWQHQIPKRKRVDQGRMNLTFRKIL